MLIFPDEYFMMLLCPGLFILQMFRHKTGQGNPHERFVLSFGSDRVPGVCMVVMVVVVIRVVVVSSSVGNKDMGFLDPDRPAADEGCKAVVRSPGEIAVAVDSVWPCPGTACVGLVVVPKKPKVWIVSSPISNQLLFEYECGCLVSVPVPKYSLLCRAAWIRSPGG